MAMEKEKAKAKAKGNTRTSVSAGDPPALPGDTYCRWIVLRFMQRDPSQEPGSHIGVRFFFPLKKTT
jgi:hypothetical protein